MDTGRGKQLDVHRAGDIRVRDHGRCATPFPRPLSQYLSEDVSTLLINSNSDVQRSLPALDMEILSIDAIIESLHMLQILKRQAYNSGLPISRLPPEILEEIFILCCSEGEDGDFDGARSPRNRPLALGHICATWRSIAWGLPRLWTTVHCRLGHPFLYMGKRRDMSTLLYQWLARSKGLPITVKLDFVDESTWANIGSSAPVAALRALLMFSKQWKSIDIILPTSWLNHLNELQDPSFPNLERLKIRPPGWQGQYRDAQAYVEAFSCAPKLYSLSYRSYLVENLDISWLNLTCATFGSPSIDEVVELLLRCPNLTTCRLVDPVPDQMGPIASITHATIEELSIDTHSNDLAEVEFQVATSILGFLTTPALRRLSLTLPRDHPSPLPDVERLINRAQCPLAVVEVFGPPIPEDEVVILLLHSVVLHIHNA